MLTSGSCLLAAVRRVRMRSREASASVLACPPSPPCIFGNTICWAPSRPAKVEVRFDLWQCKRDLQGIVSPHPRPCCRRLAERMHPLFPPFYPPRPAPPVPPFRNTTDLEERPEVQPRRFPALDSGGALQAAARPPLQGTMRLLWGDAFLVYIAWMSQEENRTGTKSDLRYLDARRVQ